jgi:hypothetical protein
MTHTAASLQYPFELRKFEAAKSHHQLRLLSAIRRFRPHNRNVALNAANSAAILFDITNAALPEKTES